MLTIEQLEALNNYARSKLISFYDPALLFSEPENLVEKLKDVHCGFYLGIVSADGQILSSNGFLKDGLENIKGSVDISLKNIFSDLSDKTVLVEKIKSATFHYSIVQKCLYISDPLAWDENQDGVYFMWGDRYKGIYLPYEIRQLNLSQTEILDRLCCHKGGVVSSLWRLPECLVHRLIVQSHAG